MKRQMRAALLGSLAAGLLAPDVVLAAPNWSTLMPFKKVEADPNKEYTLTEEHGPWLIMCRAFAGDTAREEAHALVIELRQKFKLKAYVHEQHYDFTQPEPGRGLTPRGTPKMMRPANPTEFDEIAVLVGDFQAVDDPGLQDVLETIKHAHPNSLEIRTGEEAQRFWNLRHQLSKKDKKGPMRLAFVTRNPLLPEEFFAPKGLDPLVVEMNEDLKHSLLKCRGAFTVRIASFQGHRTMRLSGGEAGARDALRENKLEEAAQNAHKVCEALRSAGVEAYEFHDIHESVVTVGSFETIGTPLPDGRIDLNPAVHAVMERYKARPIQIPGQRITGMSPTKVAGISLDVQPLPVAVPKESVGQLFARERD